ncbi:MAG: AAA family ATPase, partial [Candidatus Omnitrophica bacterium]|nr:AAA family ATPase [Candidatus Omnitrophota bacterium]
PETQEQILRDFSDILMEIHQHAKENTPDACDSLVTLLKLNLITIDNQEQIFAILKEIPHYAKGWTWRAYDSLNDLLKLNLITPDNQKQIFTILKEIPQYAEEDIRRAIYTFHQLLETLDQKHITLTDADANIIIDMIKTQEKGRNVVVTLSNINELILNEVKDPEDEGGDGEGTILSGGLAGLMSQQPTEVTLASNQGVLTEEEEESIVKEIKIHCGVKINNAIETLHKINNPELIKPYYNKEIIFTILKEIPQHAKEWTPETYKELIILLESNLITPDNQEQIFAILKEILQYAKGWTRRAYDSLIALLKSGFITPDNQKQIFAILKEIPQYAKGWTPESYNSLVTLLKSGLITPDNQKQIFAILKENPQHAKEWILEVYNSLITLLKSNLYTEADPETQKQILKDFSDILKEIPQHAKEDTQRAYNSLITLLKSNLITPDNQKQILAILKELPQYAKGWTSDAINTFHPLLEALNKKHITLTDVDASIIINMIKAQGKGENVVVTLNNIKELILNEVKDPEDEGGGGEKTGLPSVLAGLMSQQATEGILASNQGVFTKKEKKVIIKEIKIYCGAEINTTIETLHKINNPELIKPYYNKEIIFTILKELPQHAKGRTSDAYDSLIILLKSGLITPDNQEQIFAIFKEIPQYVKEYTPEAYDILIILLESGLITPNNQEQIFTILKEIPQYAKRNTQQACSSFIILLESGLVTIDNQKQILRDFSDILKELPQYVEINTWRIYDSLITLLKSGLVTIDNQEQILAILKELPQHAKGRTSDAIYIFHQLLKTLNQKHITLTDADINIIIDMIKTGGEGMNVVVTIDNIKELILSEVKDPEDEGGGGEKTRLSSGLISALKDMQKQELDPLRFGMVIERLHALYAKVSKKPTSKGNDLGQYGFTARLGQFGYQLTLVQRLRPEHQSQNPVNYTVVKEHPVIKKLIKEGVWLTPYLVDQIGALDVDRELDKFIRELNRKIESFGSRAYSIRPETLGEPEKTIFYQYLCRKFYSIMARVVFDGFEKNSLVLSILSSLKGEDRYIDDQDIIEIINLGLTIDEMIRRYVAKTHANDDLWVTSFREQVKMHTQFIRLYLSSMKDGGIEIKHTLEYFILSCLSIYGGMFGEEMEEFKYILTESINKHFDIFVKLSLGDKSLRQVDIGLLIDRLLYESFSTLERKKDGDLLWGVKPFQRTYYSLLRCVEMGQPSLFVLSRDSHRAFEEAIEKISSDTKGEVFRIPMSFFSERSDIFGMAVPDKEGNTEFLPGIIPRLIERARGNPGAPVYLVLDNIEAVQDSLRVELNPVLWERSIVIPEISKRFILPGNLHIIFTMDETGEVRDEAFLNRVLRQRVGGLDREDLRAVLINKHKINQKWADKLSDLYSRLKQEKWKQLGLAFSAQDFVNIAIYAGQRGSRLEFLKEEAYRYASLRFRYQKDKKRFSSVFEDLFGPIPESYNHSTVKIVGDKIVADDVHVNIGEEFSGYIKNNPGKPFSRIVLENYGYAIREADRMLISQMARQIASGMDNAASRVVILEGVSGEGKTQLCQVMSRILGYKNMGFTVHRRSALEEFRGGVFPGKEGLVIQNDTPFLKAEREGGYLINFSELNTSYKGALLYWLYPEFSLARKRLNSEIPAPLDAEEPFYSNSISSRNLYFVDINPDDYKAREKFPQQLKNFSATFWMGYDYSEDDSHYQKTVEEETRALVKELFSLHFPALQKKAIDRYGDTLGSLYYSIQRDFGRNRIRSLYQVLTLRDVIRTIKMFRYYSEDKGEGTEEAFKKAIKTCLWLMWQEKEPQKKIKAKLKEKGLWTEGLELNDAIRDILRSNLGHLMIHSSAVGDGYQLIKEVLPKSNKTHYMSVNDFIELESLTGGVSVDLSGRLGVFSGALLKVIEEAESDPAEEHVFVLDNFQLLNPDTAVGLNKAFQEGRIEITQQVRNVYKGRLTDDGFAVIPPNLKVVALSYTTKRPSHDNKLPMSGAELSRLASIAMPDEMTEEWLEGYLQERLSREGVTKKLTQDIISRAKDILKAYAREYNAGNHSQLRLSKADLDEYLAQIVRGKDMLSPQLIGEIAYYTIGIGLGDSESELFRPRSPPSMSYTQEKDGVYWKLNRLRHKTGYADIASGRAQTYLCPIDEILEVYQAILSAFEEDRKVILLEGPPGGGKTAISEDIARRLNSRFKKVSMYKDIDIWEFLGKIEKTGPSKFNLTCGRKEGKFISDFLDFVENGGMFCFDEANISKPSIEAISFLGQIIRGEPVDLGIYHNGVEINRHIINIHPDFKVFISINPWETTRERKDIPLQLLWLAKKIHVTDNWKEESYEKLIDYYLTDKEALNSREIKRLIRLHIFMKYVMDKQFRNFYKGDVPEQVREFKFSPFNDLYTYQYAVSPRELIRIVEMVNKKKSLFEAVLLNYLFQFSAPADLKAGVEIIESVFPGFEKFFDKWQKDRVVYFEGQNIDVSKPGHGSFFTAVDSQVSSLKALVLSLSGRKQHTLIVSEQGSYPMELVKFLSEAIGCELHVFDGNPFVNSVELLGGRMGSFGAFSPKGVAKSSGNLETAQGFIGSHLIKEDEYNEAAGKDKPLKILYLSSVEIVSSEELELLNDFLNTGRIKIGAQYYVLPENVRLVVETSVLRQKRFSSPFYNRFQKIGLNAVVEKGEVFSYLDKYYGGLTAEEKTLIYGAAKVAWYLDMGRYDHGAGYNLGRRKFAYRYGFSMKDVYKLAELVTLDKMGQAGKKEIDSVKTVLRCILRLHGNGLDDMSGKNKDSDRKIYFNALFSEIFDYEGIDEDTLKALEVEIREVKREPIEIKISAKDLNTGITLTNGLRVEKEEDETIVISTPVNKYRVGQEALRKQTELSPGLKARMEKDALVLSLDLIRSIGQMDSGVDATFGLAPEEVPRGDYIRYEGAINEAASAIFWADRRIKDVAGRERPPLPIILMGKTGGAKSTLVRNLSRITGVPLHTLHCYDNMEADALFAEMSIFNEDHERKILLSIKEFFSHFGRINGIYYYPQGKDSHSSRKILFLDEANISPKMLYCLKPLFRGDREFTFYLFGKSFKVELDPEVILIAAGNPPETYVSRKNFPWEIIEDALRIWVPALHTYIDSERIKKDDLIAVLFGMHKRRMQELKIDTQETRPPSIARQELYDNSCPLIELKRIKGKAYKVYNKRKSPYEPKKHGEKKKISELIKKDISFKYSVQEIEKGLTESGSIPDKIRRYQYFLDNILKDYLLALSDGTAGMEDYKKGNKTSLTFRVLDAARSIDKDLFAVLQGIVMLYEGQSISYSQIKKNLLDLRKIVLDNKKINRFVFSFPIIKEEKVFVMAQAEEIVDTTTLGQAETERLGLPVGKYEDRMPVSSYVVKKHPFMEDTKARGVYKGGNYALVYEGPTLAGGDIERDTLLSWVGYHELGHLIDNMRILGEEITPHPNVELFSMLFPVIFSRHSLGYMNKELLDSLKKTKNRDSYYCQAAKGIFNGFLRILKEKNPKDSSLQEIQEISDSFENNRIDAIHAVINKLREENINETGILLYRDAWEKRFTGDYYLSTAKKGHYVAVSKRVRGDTIEEFTEGLDTPPDVEILEEEDQEEIERKIEIISDAEEKEETPVIEFDEGAGRGRSDGDKISTDGVVEKMGWLETYYERLGSFAKRFIDIFASEPIQEEIYAASGRKLDIRKWITLSQKVFRKTVLEESTPTLCMGVTVDISGSITGRRKLVNAFTNMTKFFESLLYIAGRDTANVQFSLSAIGEEFHRIFGFEECKNEDVLRASIGRLWGQNDFGGINTESLIEGLKLQYRQSMIPMKNRIQVVLTDGGETSGKNFKKLREMVNAFEEKYGVDVIFIGIGTDEVANYSRYLLLDEEPNDNQLINILIKIAEEKVQRGSLPPGDLGKELDLETGSSKSHRSSIESNPASPDQGLTLASNQGVFKGVFSQKEMEEIYAISDEIKTHCWPYREAALQALFKISDLVEIKSYYNRKSILSILRNMPEYAQKYTFEAYRSLINLLESNLITKDNQEQILAILKELPQYAEEDGESISKAYHSLVELLKSDLITPDNQEQMFTFLKKIPQHAKIGTWRAYDSLTILLKSNLYTEVNPETQEQILRDFSDILNKITRHVEKGELKDAFRAFHSLYALLESNLITPDNQKQIFAILKEIPQYTKNYTWHAYYRLITLLKSNLYTEANPETQEQILRDFSDILMEIPQYAKDDTPDAYDRLDTLLESNLITPDNQKQIFAILKELPQYAKGYTPEAINTFHQLLETLDQKHITLTDADIKIITNMIKAQGKGRNVIVTIDNIKELILNEVKDPEDEGGGGKGTILSGGLAGLMSQQPTEVTLASNQGVFTEEEEKSIIEEIKRHCGAKINTTIETLHKINNPELIKPYYNKEIIFTILRDLPQYAEELTEAAFHGIYDLLKLNLITPDNQEQIFTILKETPQHAGMWTKESYSGLITLLKSNLITLDNQEQIFTILKEIIPYARKYTVYTYASLITMLKSNLCAGADPETQKQILKDFSDILKEIPEYAERDTPKAHGYLDNLLESGLITPDNQKQIFAILKEIPQYAKEDTWRAYNSHFILLQLNVIKKHNQKQILRDFLDIIKGSYEYTKDKDDRESIYDKLNSLLISGLINEHNQEQIFAVFNEITRYAKDRKWDDYYTLTELLKSDLINERNQKQIFTILKEIPQYAKEYTWQAYNSIITLLESGLITIDNQEQIFTILKELPQYAEEDTPDAIYTFHQLLETLDQKHITLTDADAKIIIDMIKTQGEGKNVVVTLDNIKELILNEVKDPEDEGGEGKGTRLSSGLAGLMSQQQATEVTLASNQGVFSKKEKKVIIKEIKRHCGAQINTTIKYLHKINNPELIKPYYNKEIIVTILKEIPQHAKEWAFQAYNTLVTLLKSNLITPDNQKQIFAILKEIPQHAKGWTNQAYDSLITLLKLNLITPDNQKQIFTILKELPQYAKRNTWRAYDRLNDLLESGIITPDNQKQIFAILKEIPQHAKENTPDAYDRLITLLKSNFITIDNQNQILAILKEIPQYAKGWTNQAYDSLITLLKSNLYTGADPETQEQILRDFSDILKEIPKYAERDTPKAHGYLDNLLKSGLITPDNQKQIFIILKEFPQHAKGWTPE